MPSTYSLLTPVIAAMNGTILIKSVTTNSPGNYTLEICDSKWLTQGFELTIQTKTYKVVSFEPNLSITITGDLIAPIKGSFVLYPPKFYHGTVKSTEEELNKKINSKLLTVDRLPMIWLKETVDEQMIMDQIKATGMNSDAELYFMIDSNFAAWTNDDHFKYAITPMRQMFDCFITAIKETKYINDDLIKIANMNDYSRWGTTIKDGNSKQIFNIQMSGVRASMILPFIKQDKYCC